MNLIVVFKLYFIAVCADFITGVTAAAKEGKLKSRTCAYGMYRSIGEILVLGLAIIVFYYVPMVHDIIQYIMLGFLFKEGLSICENLKKLDVWLPEMLTKTLELKVNKVDKGEK